MSWATFLADSTNKSNFDAWLGVALADDATQVQTTYDYIVEGEGPGPGPDEHVFDDTIPMSDLSTGEAGGQDVLFTFDTAGSTKFANINEFDAGDAVQFETGNDEVTFIGASGTSIEITFGELGEADGAWFVTFYGLDADLVHDVGAEATIADQLEVLGTHWDLSNNDWLQVA